MKKSKTKIHITVIRCNATITPEIKLKDETFFFRLLVEKRALESFC